LLTPAGVANPSRSGALWFVAACAILCAASLLCALRFGSVHLATADWLQVLRGGGSDLARQIVLELRLPRALNGMAVGAMLALAGTLMQVLLRNPLADPYILGISSGAAVAALTGLSLGWGLLARQSGAFAGALLVMLLVYGIARADRGFAPLKLLLTGVVIAAGLNAVISLLLATSDDTSLRGMLFWMMGDLSLTTSPLPALIAATLALLLTGALARALDVLSLGDRQAAIVGLPVVATRLGIYVGASLITAIAVTTAGSIGFVGLVVPHTVRLLWGPAHRVVVPASAFLGGALLVCADTLARTLVAPRQLPVGALTAMVGVPFFLYLMHRSRPAP